ncbi:daunorubicin resistance protein DrrA family ABC transporter ATP-binding protein [Streptomyces longispororuber]|uniref:Daunorubicin resistance protein DrrA family ABC transporter ATP-binding protein n=1 Tax=Streptomyces longispororuber TaxID=68230 RepID=A0A919A0Q6_9ACTN|nr:ATP-binding cassette domain-containing protein [Streptomyces longispororuber]GHE80899.1 daunorubicin resistance protein DrrA family ABC transporter ATP-binding protein [Streptomyces longispororuber]
MSGDGGRGVPGGRRTRDDRGDRGQYAVLARGLTKRYGGRPGAGEARGAAGEQGATGTGGGAVGSSGRRGGRRGKAVKYALDGFDLTVAHGTVHGLLGPNGAGKTTAVRILATLVRPDGGHAAVGGADVVREPALVRARIGLTGQYAAVDEMLTGRQNLEMFGRLFHLGARRAARRAAELLDQFGLVAAADKGAGQYSGGMRRRLDLAASMILAPSVLFLDEPTTGLDPRSRSEVWDSVRHLVAGGTTVLLTTQYLEEADKLASRITVIDQGRAIADDTPDGLKATVGGSHLEVVVSDAADLPAAVKAVARVADGEPETADAERRVRAAVTDRVGALADVARTLRDEGVAVDDVGLRRPSLDDVFLKLTGGRAPAAEGPGTEEAA